MAKNGSGKQTTALSPSACLHASGLEKPHWTREWDISREPHHSCARAGTVDAAMLPRSPKFKPAEPIIIRMTTLLIAAHQISSAHAVWI
jgi:hypothetical protein